MRIRKRSEEIQEGDLTPMIDMTFQLIAFFMVLINFSQSEQNDRVQLPQSELAKPPDSPLEFPITLHVTTEGSVILGGEEIQTLSGLRPYLTNEANILEIKNQTPADATIVVRAHKEAKIGRVQEIVKVCQENGFEKFVFRAKEDVGND